MTEHEHEWWIGTSWKMNKLRAEAVRDAKQIAAGVAELDARLRFFVAPSSVSLAEVSASLHVSRVQTMAQEARPEPAGAFTGALSVPMALDAGARIVQAGHAESRRAGQTDGDIRGVLTATLASGARAVLVVGEPAPDRRASHRDYYVVRSVESALSESARANIENLILVYEPQWALGGAAATPTELADVVGPLREWLSETAGDAGQQVPVLYAGGVSVETVDSLMGVRGINGFVLGRAGLEPESFLAVAGRVSESISSLAPLQAAE